MDPVKYPHSPHLPWSPGFDADEDMVLESVDHWKGRQVVITEKMNGECSTLFSDYYHARSTIYAPHPSRTHCRAIWGRVRHNIPEGFRVCGENVSAVHSIRYDNLPSYFLVFSIWNGDVAFSWDETEEWCGLMGAQHRPCLMERGLGRRQVQIGYRRAGLGEAGRHCSPAGGQVPLQANPGCQEWRHGKMGPPRAHPD